jgi:hypothetical protein
LFARAEGLGDEGVQPQQYAADAKAERVEEDLRERGGGHGECGVGQVAEHDGVDHGHGHPAEFAGDERQGKAEQRRQLAADVGEADAHTVAYRMAAAAAAKRIAGERAEGCGSLWIVMK